MILITKFLFGSVAVATLAGSVVIPEAADAVRSIAASLGWPEDAATAETPPLSASVVAPALTHGSHRCGGSCDVWALLAQIR